MLKTNYYRIHICDLISLYNNSLPITHIYTVVAHALSIDSLAIRTRAEIEVTFDQKEWIHKSFSDLSRGVPLSRVVGSREFWSLSFDLSNETFDPRADSEVLLEEVIKFFPSRGEPFLILDLGTGSGCLLIALLLEYPNSIGIGTDISGSALRIAYQNATKHKVNTRSFFVQANWCEGITGSFDIVVSNPPYVSLEEKRLLSKEVLLYDPPTSLFAGSTGLENYQLIIPKLCELISKGGKAFFEIRPGMEDSILSISQKSGLVKLSLAKDLAGLSRCLSVQRHD